MIQELHLGLLDLARASIQLQTPFETFLLSILANLTVQPQIGATMRRVALLLMLNFLTPIEASLCF